jgi:hypothetical protein
MSYIENNDAAMTFFPDGRVYVRIPPGTGAVRNDTLPISAITSTGVIGVKNGDIRVKGTYHGQVTLLARKGTTGSGIYKGNVWIDGNIMAANNPAGDPSSPDMLGLVSERIIYITKDNSRNASSVLNIQAAMYSHAGVFTAQDFWTIGIHGRINLLGSLTQINRGPVGTFSGGAIQHGFMKSYRFDPRYLTQAPPFFPASNKYELVSWWEN